MRVVLEERGTTGREDIMALSLGLSLEHRTHTRPKLEPDLAMQLTLARVGWVCWGDAHRDVDCDTVHNQPVLVRTQRRTQTWVECHEQHCGNTLALWPRTVRAQARWENHTVRVVSGITV